MVVIIKITILHFLIRQTKHRSSKDFSLYCYTKRQIYHSFTVSTYLSLVPVDLQAVSPIINITTQYIVIVIKRRNIDRNYCSKIIAIVPRIKTNPHTQSKRVHIYSLSISDKPNKTIYLTIHRSDDLHSFSISILPVRIYLPVFTHFYYCS